MSRCPSCGAFPGSDHHEACTVRARGLRNRDRSESIQKLIDENQRLREALQELQGVAGYNSPAHHVINDALLGEESE